MKKIIRILAINCTVFLAVLMFIDISAAIYYYVKTTVLDQSNATYSQSLLPYYQKVEWGSWYFDDLDKCQTRYESFYGWRSQPCASRTINIDIDGIRRTIQKEGLRDSMPKVTFLGGSTVWGAGSNDAKTIPSLFAQLSNLEFNVANFGESGYNAIQSLYFFLIQTFKGHRPDVVITIDGVNNNPVFGGGRYKHFVEDQIRQYTKFDRDEHVLKHLLAPTKRAVKGINKRFRKEMRHEAPVFTKQQNQDAAKELLESWLMLKSVCDHEGIIFICVLQPSVFVGEPSIDHLSLSSIDEQFMHAYEYYSDVIKMIQEERYVKLIPHFLDFRSIYDKIPNLYIDNCHVTPEGNEIMARLISQQLDQRLNDGITIHKEQFKNFN